MSNKESVQRTVIVALLLCVVCSVIVSAAAVLLKPAQTANREADRSRNILAIAGLLQDGVPIKEQVKQLQPRVVDLTTGKFTDAVTPEQVMDAKKVSRDPAKSQAVPGDEDIAKILRRENYSVVYLVEKDGQLDRVILPIRGYGLWSTLWGFITLQPDMNTVVGMGFYQHAETPGLGGEVDNPGWKQMWQGKQVYAGDDVALTVLKGKALPESPTAKHEIDGLSGATLTSKGVDNMIKYWLGSQGFGPFLKNLKSGEA